MKITGYIEQIFAVAVALDQSGGLRNSIYAINNEVFIINYDHTVLLRFRLRKTESPFKNPISFNANDYDSNEFYEEGGKIIFICTEGNMQRKKSCKISNNTPTEIKDVFLKFIKRQEECAMINISKSILSLLDVNLSHIEFSGIKGSPIKLIQRNIYSGSVIEIQEKTESTLFQSALPFNIEPIALKTNDFVALFSFQDNLKFYFNKSEKEANWILVKSVDAYKRDMTGIVACCIYDEIIQIKGGK